MSNKNNDLSILKWSKLKKSLQEYFRPIDFHKKAHGELANCK